MKISTHVASAFGGITMGMVAVALYLYPSSLIYVGDNLPVGIMGLLMSGFIVISNLWYIYKLPKNDK